MSSEAVNRETAQAPGLASDVRQLLTALQINVTSQRLQIASIFLSAPMHLSAEQLLERLRHGGERVSKATVYNTLKLFVERGLVRQINLDPQRTVYDSTRSVHHHFHDVEAGVLWDIDPKDVEFSRLPQLPEGMEIAGVEVIIRVTRKPSESALN